MDQQRLALLKRKLEALSYDGELDTKSAPLAEKVRTPPARLPRMAEKWQGPPQLRFEFRAERGDTRRADPRPRARALQSRSPAVPDPPPPPTRSWWMTWLRLRIRIAR